MEKGNDNDSIESGEIKEEATEEVLNRKRERDSSEETIQLNKEEDIIVFDEDNNNSNVNRIRRKDRIKQILAKANIPYKPSPITENKPQSNHKKSISSIEMLEYISNQRETLNQDEHEQSSSSSSSTPDMFSDEKPKKENNTKNIDLGLSTKNESIGYYIPKIGELIQNKYKIVGLCGKGIFSSVVKVVDITSNIGYALKIIRNIDIMKASGDKEKTIITFLNKEDPQDKSYIIQLISSFEISNHICMLFPLYKMNLRDLLKETKNGLPLSTVKLYAKQLILAFILIHKNHLIHADFKPDNTVLNESYDAIRVCDFGSALYEDESIITSELVSRYYRAPEIILGIKPNTKIDIWSLGCTLYEIYTGKILFSGRNNSEMIKMFIEVNGRFGNKILKKGEYTPLYFTEDFNYFKWIDINESKAQNVIVKNIDVNTLKRKDIKTLIAESSLKKKENDKEVKQFINLIENCLTIDPYKRISAIDAYTHPFLWK